MEKSTESSLVNLEDLHEFLSARNIVKSRYWIISYCTFCVFMGFLLGLLIGAEYAQRGTLENKTLYKTAITHANDSKYYEVERRK